jgi:hypothetical protein
MNKAANKVRLNFMVSPFDVSVDIARKPEPARLCDGGGRQSYRHISGNSMTGTGAVFGDQSVADFRITRPLLLEFTSQQRAIHADCAARRMIILFERQNKTVFDSWAQSRNDRIIIAPPCCDSVREETP